MVTTVVAAAAGGWIARGQLQTGFAALQSRVGDLRPAPRESSDASPSPPPGQTPPVAAPPTGRLEVRSTPEGARVLVDGEERGVTPLTIDDLPPGTHTVALESASGSLQRRVDVTAGGTTTIDEAIYSGWLQVSSTIELEITEGASILRLNDQNQVLLRPGSHSLRFENRRLGYGVARRVTITPGQTTAISIVPEKSALTVAATLPAEVLIDGVRAGGTPLSDYPVDLGTREVTVRSLDGIERRATITVGAQPARLDIDFSKP